MRSFEPILHIYEEIVLLLFHIFRYNATIIFQEVSAMAQPDRSELYRHYWLWKAQYECRSCDNHTIRMGQVQRYIMEHMPVPIRPDDLLHGWLVCRPLTEKEDQEFTFLEQWVQNCPQSAGFYPAATGHRVLDYEKLLTLGANGVLHHLDSYLKTLDYSDPQAMEKYNLYTACRESILGLIHYAQRVSQAYAQAAGEQSDSVVQAQYRQLSQIFSRVPAEPARTFYEAMQSMWTLQYISCFLHDKSLTGRPADYLYPYYTADKAAGRIDDTFVQTLINDLYYRHNDIYDNWPAPIMIGGVNRQGEPIWNELSYMFIRAIAQTGMVNPSVGICWNEAMPADLMQLCVQTIADGYTRPAFFNDAVVIDGLLQAGVTLEDARYYIHSTCVEITPIATSHIYVASPYVHINKAIEMVLNDGKKLWGDDPVIDLPAEIQTDRLETFEQFFHALKHAMSLLIRAAATERCRVTEQWKQYHSAPLSACFLRDCLARGKDCGSGGARYNFTYPCFPGFINLIDSVAAVKKAVYEDRLFTLPQLREILLNDFSGAETAQQYLLNRCPKFGNDIADTDELGLQLYDHIRNELAKYRTCLPNGTFHPSYFAWIMHAELGKVAAASPDGRKQGTAMSESLGAAQGRDRNGPLAVVRSISHIDQSYGIGGIATNFRFSKSMIQSAQGQNAVTSLIKGFMAARCFECQFNVVDQEVLLDARAHPENYQSLLVRVAGYSDYFVRLDPLIQDEIIRRTEHDSL